MKALHKFGLILLLTPLLTACPIRIGPTKPLKLTFQTPDQKLKSDLWTYWNFCDKDGGTSTRWEFSIYKEKLNIGAQHFAKSADCSGEDYQSYEVAEYTTNGFISADKRIGT